MSRYSLVLLNFIDIVIIKIFFLAIQAMVLSGVFSLTTAISAYESKKNSGMIMSFSIGFSGLGSIIFQPIFGYVAEYYGKEYLMHILIKRV